MKKSYSLKNISTADQSTEIDEGIINNINDKIN